MVSRELFSAHRKEGEELDEGTEAKICYLLNKKVFFLVGLPSILR